MIRRFFFGALLLAASPVAAEPQKLIVLWGNAGVAVTDYPNAERCQAALRALKARSEQERKARGARREGNEIVIPPPWQMEAICIPG